MELHYSSSTLLGLILSVATIVACILPTIAIGILLLMTQTVLQKLYLIGGFTALFAASLLWLRDPRASRSSIYSAAAG